MHSVSLLPLSRLSSTCHLPFRLNRGFKAGFSLNHSASLLPLLLFPFRLNLGFEAGIPLNHSASLLPLLFFPFRVPLLFYLFICHFCLHFLFLRILCRFLLRRNARLTGCRPNSYGFSAGLYSFSLFRLSST
jgi:hypothetical protein